MSKRARLSIFGVDGMSHELTRALMRAGRLPNLAAFARDAPLRPLRCTWPPHTATGWASFVSGALPGQHGIFQFWDCQDPDYQHRIVPRTALGRPSLFDALAEAGLDIGMVNLPMSHPPSEWPGYEVTWPLVPTLHFFRPPEIFRELRSVGGHVRSDIMSMYDGSLDYPARARTAIQARSRGMTHLSSAHATDVIGVVHTEIDRVSHHYWGELDGVPGVCDVIAGIYAEVDRAFGEHLGLTGDDAAVIVVSDHGFGPCARGLGIHRLLAEGGFCAIHQIAGEPEPGFGDHAGVSHLALSLDWSRTTAYMPTPGCFGVSVNLQGRQRRGIVTANAYDGTLDALRSFVLQQRDPLDGGPLFSAAVPREVAYPGPFVASAPDLLLVPRDPGLLLLADPRAPLWGSAGQDGLHRIDGVAMFRPRRQAPAAGDAALGIEALAGMLLDDLGIEARQIPRHSSQAVRDAAAFLPEGAWQASPSQPSTAPRGRPAPRPPLQTDASIEERLRFLGYW